MKNENIILHIKILIGINILISGLVNVVGMFLDLSEEITSELVKDTPITFFSLEKISFEFNLLNISFLIANFTLIAIGLFMLINSKETLNVPIFYALIGFYVLFLATTKQLIIYENYDKFETTANIIILMLTGILTIFYSMSRVNQNIESKIDLRFIICIILGISYSVYYATTSNLTYSFIVAFDYLMVHTGSIYTYIPNLPFSTPFLFPICLLFGIYFMIPNIKKNMEAEITDSGINQLRLKIISIIIFIDGLSRLIYLFNLLSTLNIPQNLTGISVYPLIFNMYIFPIIIFSLEFFYFFKTIFSAPNGKEIVYQQQNYEY